MYLYKSIYVGACWKHRKVTGQINIYTDGEPINVDFKKVHEIVEDVAYWRKANQIHNWFVNNVQDGNDDCRRYYVDSEKLIELVAICKRVRDDHSLAEELLPTQEGFFFGSTDYGDGYYQDIEDTIEQLKDIDTDVYSSYYYESSW